MLNYIKTAAGAEAAAAVALSPRFGVTEAFKAIAVGVGERVQTMLLAFGGDLLSETSLK